MRTSFHPTYLLVTPTGMPHVNTFRDMVIDAGLRILKQKTDVIVECAVTKLFGRKNPQLQKWVTFFRGKNSQVMIIEGQNAVSEVSRLCGESIVPNECSPDSIRHKFPAEGEMYEGNVWFPTPVLTTARTQFLRTDFATFGLEEFLDRSKWQNGTH